MALIDINQANGEEVAARTGATFSMTDVANHQAAGAQIAKTVADFGRLSCMVSNACLHQYAHIEATPPTSGSR